MFLYNLKLQLHNKLMRQMDAARLTFTCLLIGFNAFKATLLALEHYRYSLNQASV